MCNSKSCISKPTLKAKKASKNIMENGFDCGNNAAQEGSEMHQMGRVVSVDGNIATVRFVRSKMCERCGACIHFGDKEAEVEIKNTLDAKEGDMVRVELRAKSFLQASLIAYILPLIMLVLGVALGTQISDLWGVILGILGAALVFFVLRALEPRFARKEKFNPRMIDMIDLPYDTKENEQGGNEYGE